MSSRYMLIMIALGLPLAGCEKKPTPTPEAKPASSVATPNSASPAPVVAHGNGPFEGKVLETMDSGGYTYVRVGTAQGEIWAATRVFKVAVGAEVVVPAGTPMRQFQSKTLNRTFESIYFVGSIQVRGAAATTPVAPHPTAPSKPAPSEATVEVGKIEKAEGGHTIAEIYAQQSKLGSTSVKVRGKVVKVNNGIMGTNWVHLRDGTGSDGQNDLTVTTNDTTSVGSVVVATGTLALNKDFGGGYKYAVILEKAKLQ